MEVLIEDYDKSIVIRKCLCGVSRSENNARADFSFINELNVCWCASVSSSDVKISKRRETSPVYGLLDSFRVHFSGI